jgi:hypothetical protein
MFVSLFDLRPSNLQFDHNQANVPSYLPPCLGKVSSGHM